LGRTPEPAAVEARTQRLASETHVDNGASIAFREAVGCVNEGPFTVSDGDEMVAFHLDPLARVRL